ncbi:hypothetical protein ACLB2K_011523 [Fragaria x ananassa]
MSCITTTSFQICFNGELTSSFKAQRGIRQGDPLISVHFCSLHGKTHIISSAVDAGKWKPVRASQSGPKVSHLFFADDLMLSAEASSTQAHVLKGCLDAFCALSGQAVSFEKSLIFCSPNTSKSLASEISRKCGSPLTSDLGRYLGVPLIHTRINKHTYEGIFVRIQSRLASWKCKTLSMAGRLTLVQSVTSSIPIYSMQTVKFPVSLCERIDKLNRDFIWGDNNEKKRVHLVNWETVCQPKCLGGLGVKKTEDMNQAMLAKASWRIFKQDSGLWASIYSEKYLNDCSIIDQNYIAPADCSSTWRSMAYGTKLMRSNLSWRIGDGKMVKFWSDTWVLSVPLLQFALPHAVINLSSTVCDFWCDTGWNIEMLSDVVPPEVVNQIISFPTGFEDSGNDQLIWKATSNGVFSENSAYISLFDMAEPQHHYWKVVWKLNCPPKLKTFFWTVLHKKILTNVQRVRRRFTTSAVCPICNSADESLLHLFRDCYKSKEVWKSICPSSHISNSFILGWDIGFLLNCFVNPRSRMVSNGATSLSVCWFLWKWSNKIVFDSGFVMPGDPALVIWNYVEEWTSAQSNPSSSNMFNVTYLSWLRPPANCLKLNIDGTRSSSSGKIGAGGGAERSCCFSAAYAEEEL